MTSLHKFSLNGYLLTAVVACLLCASASVKGETRFKQPHFYSPLTADTIKPLLPGQPPKSPQAIPSNTSPPRPDTAVRINIDTIPSGNRDSIRPRTDTFNLRISKDTLDGPVNYEAEDSAVIQVDSKKIILYGKTKTTYKDVVLTAPTVELENETGLVTAYSSRDSTGDVVERARFRQAENNFQSDRIQFNFKTQKGITQNTFTQQQEMFVQGEQIKKVSPNTVFVRSGRFTTCNLDEPHFGFRASKLKLINQKAAITGPVHPEFEGVPVPIYLPFGYFPLSRGRKSGLLPPIFTATEQFGLGLEGLGYYQVLNDYYDVTLRGNIYSYGGWMANLTPTYRKRYRYQGVMNLSVNQTKIAFKGDPDFFKTTTYGITWSHTVDQRARPGTTFSANVNATSPGYNRFLVNQPMRNFQNQLGSSIAYGKTWTAGENKDKQFNLSLNANHQQNNRDSTFFITLPDASFTVNTIFPFQRKDAIGSPKWYEKLGLQYNGVARNQLSFKSGTGQNTISSLLDTLQWGAQHRIPVTLALPPMGPIIIAPSLSYTETWFQQINELDWNSNGKKVDTITRRGFFAARDITTGLAFSTQLFGTFGFRKGKVSAIRHVVRPQISANYSPNLVSRYVKMTQVDSTGRTQLLSAFQTGNLFTAPAGIEFGGLSFGVDNNLEMKVRNKDSTQKDRKVRLIDAFGFTGAYNFLADSQQLSDINIYLRTTLFDKVNITTSALLSPYGEDRFGGRTNNFVWEDGRGVRIGRLTQAMFALSTQFQSKPRDAEKAKAQQQQQAITDPLLLGDQQRLMEYMQRNPSEFVDFNTAWSLGFDVSVALARVPLPNFSGFQNQLNGGLNFRNSFSLTPKWNFSTFGNFDFRTTKLQTFSMSINRDLHCWQMAIQVTPVGPFPSFSFTISPKSGLLQDLRVNRTRVFTNFQ